MMDDINRKYDYWQAALAGQKPKPVVDQPELGFYRKGLYERNDKGNNRRVGWEPVAIWMNGATLILTHLGGDTSVRDRINEAWSYCCDNPISEEIYRAVAERGEPWPDAHDPSKNKPSTHPVLEGVTAASPENVLAAQLAEAKAGVSQYDKIDSDTMAGQALSLKNTITSLAGELNKHREALVRPHIDAQKAVNDRLNPIINDAKASAASLLKALGSWEDQKRAAARLAQETADRAAREHAEAVRKAEMSDTEAPPPPAPVIPNTPAPSIQVAAAVGRKASVKVKQFVISIDEDKAFAMFKGNTELSALLLALTQKAVDAGMPVPGAVTEERSVVR